MSKRISAISIPAFAVIIAALYILDIRVVFEPPLLLFILNTVFVAAVSLVVAYVSAMGYLTGGSIYVLMLGCGVLLFGSASLAAGWLIGPPGGPNVNVTIHNTGALLAAILHFASATLTASGLNMQVTRSRKSTLILAYLGGLVSTALLAIASLQGAIPPFFIQGVGPTPLRQVVLGSAIVLFALSSLIFIRRYSKSKIDILYWYSLGLALIGLGLSTVSLQKLVGSPLGWAGRAAQYLGGMYLLIAVLTTTRGTRTEKAQS